MVRGFTEIGGRANDQPVVVYFNGDRSSLNELLLETNKAVLYVYYCGVSEFADEDWVTSYGC